MSIRDAYDRWATTYDADRNLTRDLDAEVTREALAGFGGARVLEIGCGTGKNTAWLARMARRVLALDFSAAMLREAQARLRAAGAGNVALALADFTQPWPCAARWAGLVTCNLVLEHIADLPPIFEQAHRVLMPGGRLFVSELHPDRQALGKRATFRHGAAQIEIPAFIHHLPDYAAAAKQHGFAPRGEAEWRHETDTGEPPRLIVLLYEKT